MVYFRCCVFITQNSNRSIKFYKHLCTTLLVWEKKCKSCPVERAISLLISALRSKPFSSSPVFDSKIVRRVKDGCY
uniref:Ovule protein n=1 Tax=Ascaris lumbricoides TaxID=6252 RepID=A0A0M3I6F0_ASCLU